MDPDRPLAEQVTNARVLIPTTGLVTAADIAAPKDLRLVAQPAAGYNNIDVEAAKQRGVPVTLAPGASCRGCSQLAYGSCDTAVHVVARKWPYRPCAVLAMRDWVDRHMVPAWSYDRTGLIKLEGMVLQAAETGVTLQHLATPTPCMLHPCHAGHRALLARCRSAMQRDDVKRSMRQSHSCSYTPYTLRATPHTLPGYNSHSVAEVVLMMILMLSRRADEARAVFEAREPIGRPVGRELNGKTLGIVGMGKVGTCLAAAARGLGMEVGTTLLGSGLRCPWHVTSSCPACTIIFHTP